MTPFFIALQFLTTFPIQLKDMPTQQQNAQSLLFYPVVGCIIGLLLFAVATVFSSLPVILLSSLILVLWIWLTGGLHLDGLADTADAWVGGFGDRERTLQIMKDPSCGPIGVLSLVIVCLMKWSALYVLLDLKIYAPLILIPILGRLAPLFLFLSAPYVRKNGLGSSMAELLPKKTAKIFIFLCLMMSVVFTWIGVISAVIFILCLIYLRHKFIQRISGITGDTIGASIEISEMVFALSFVILLSYCSYDLLLTHLL